ncbi:acyltransferase [Fibrobacter sp. UWB11]|uniref:acyltransferase family protein n=1 Tax=Fibrobacter sp. UWB11 TaxID=1896202 RepID=UPI000928F7BA|nr:acyltransferase [Fibrobacter sp. UWB11]SIO10474.1 Surface polysaccharide O-acyltransferase, integral membrane enzyme [Fibrobacter sp. UWB11]
MLNQQESRSISSLKVIFCFLIILLHAHYHIPSVESVSDVGSFVYELQKFIREYFSTFLADLAIPGFALISGYLFFATAEFSKEAYNKKIKNRVFTLLIPYIVWNLIVFAGDVALAFLGKNNLVNNTEWDFLNVLNIFWSIKGNGAGTCPYNGPLWYIRDLFILCLLTPVIYPLLKSRFFKYIFGVALLVALFVNIPYVYYHERIFTIYFCLGAFFAVNQIKLFSFSNCVNKILLTGGVANMLYFIDYFGWMNFSAIPLKQIFVLCALLVFPSIALKYLQNEKIVGLASGTFFIYCMHNSFLSVLGPLIKGQSSVVYLLYYLLLPVLDFATGYVLYLGIKKLNNPILNLCLIGKKKSC